MFFAASKVTYAQNYIPSGAGPIEIYMMYSKMRPMALVKFLENGGKGWGRLSDKIIPTNKMREITLQYAGYKIATMFDDEADVLTVEYPYDSKIYNADVAHLISNGFERKDEPLRKGNKITEGYQKSSEWIIIAEKTLDSNNRITTAKYYFILHP